jgi:hypothetical protein
VTIWKARRWFTDGYVFKSKHIKQGRGRRDWLVVVSRHCSSYLWGDLPDKVISMLGFKFKLEVGRRERERYLRKI